MEPDFHDADDILVPLHEAAHTVVAHALGIEVVHTSLSKRHTLLGQTFSSDIGGPSSVTRENAARGALFCLAGSLREELLMGLQGEGLEPIPPGEERGPAVNSDGNQDDLFHAYRFTRVLCGPGGDAHGTITRLMHWARDILLRHDEAVLALAEELRQTELLLGAASREIWRARGGKAEPATFVRDVLEDLRGRGLLST